MELEREVNFPDNLVNIRIQANSPYQIKRMIEGMEQGKGFLLMSKSDIKINRKDGPRLRVFATFKDLKSDKLAKQKEKKKRERYNEQ
jgi:hypothetical protein